MIRLIGGLVLGLVIAGGLYGGLCLIAPFRPCWSCTPGRHCRRCDGTGLRLRRGRWLINHLRSAYRDTN